MNSRAITAFAALALALAAGVAVGEDDLTSLSYISYLERYATVRPAQGSESLDAVVNMPVLVGDRLDTGRGARVEVQIADGATLWLDEFTTVDFDAVVNSRDAATARTAFYLADGSIVIEIPAAAAGDGTVRLETKGGTVYLNRPGLYRLDVERGELKVEAHRGLAELPDGVGSLLLRGGEAAVVRDGATQQRVALASYDDSFWSWVESRRRPAGTRRTAQYVDARDADRAAVLDAYGDWVYVASTSAWMWRPRVSVTWMPYSYGRWYWTPVGYTWISYEPWGWYPFHYGSWYFDSSFGWCWGWEAVWGPSWVHWIYTPGYVGWCPRGYYDWWYARSCTHCWGGGRGPHRWSEVGFDFSGRVRLRDIDQRPWTFVPDTQFGAQHIDRAKVDPGRILRELPDRDAFVRSGPLVTRVPTGELTERTLGEVFRDPGGARQGGDLTSVLRRQVTSDGRAAGSANEFSPIRTRDVVAPFRFEGGQPNGSRSVIGRPDRPTGPIGGRTGDERPTVDSPRIRLPRVTGGEDGQTQETGTTSRRLPRNDEGTTRSVRSPDSGNVHTIERPAPDVAPHSIPRREIGGTTQERPPVHQVEPPPSRPNVEPRSDPPPPPPPRVESDHPRSEPQSRPSGGEARFSTSREPWRRAASPDTRRNGVTYAPPARIRSEWSSETTPRAARDAGWSPPARVESSTWDRPAAVTSAPWGGQAPANERRSWSPRARVESSTWDRPAAASSAPWGGHATANERRSWSPPAGAATAHGGAVTRNVASAPSRISSPPTRGSSALGRPANRPTRD